MNRCSIDVNLCWSYTWDIYWRRNSIFRDVYRNDYAYRYFSNFSFTADVNASCSFCWDVYRNDYDRFDNIYREIYGNIYRILN
jgi:hypothetical protein